MQLKQLEMKFDGNLIRKFKKLSLRFNGKEKQAGELAAILKQKGIEPDDELINELLSFLYGENEAVGEGSPKNTENLLKLTNHKNGWIFVPYEIVRAGKDVLGNGVIRVLLDSANHTKKLNFNININSKEYFFALDFEEKMLKKVRMNVTPEPLNHEMLIEALKKKLADFGNIHLTWAEKEKIEGTSCDEESFYTVGGLV